MTLPKLGYWLRAGTAGDPCLLPEDCSPSNMAVTLPPTPPQPSLSSAWEGPRVSAHPHSTPGGWVPGPCSERFHKHSTTLRHVGFCFWGAPCCSAGGLRACIPSASRATRQPPGLSLPCWKEGSSVRAPTALPGAPWGPGRRGALRAPGGVTAAAISGERALLPGASVTRVTRPPRPPSPARPAHLPRATACAAPATYSSTAGTGGSVSRRPRPRPPAPPTRPDLLAVPQLDLALHQRRLGHLLSWFRAAALAPAPQPRVTFKIAPRALGWARRAGPRAGRRHRRLQGRRGRGPFSCGRLPHPHGPLWPHRPASRGGASAPSGLGRPDQRLRGSGGGFFFKKQR